MLGAAISEAEQVWRSKTDEQVAEAARNLEDYTEEGRRIISAELARRRSLGHSAQHYHQDAKPLDTEDPSSGNRILMRLNGSKFLTNTWKQELTITEDGVSGEVLTTGKRVRMSLPFDRIAQVNLVRGLLTATLELVNKGGHDNLCIRGLNKEEAENAKQLLEDKIRE